MIPLAELIDHWQERERHCRKEIDDLVARFNANPPSSQSLEKAEASLKRATKMWDTERRLARDTASYLQVLVGRMARAA